VRDGSGDPIVGAKVTIRSEVDNSTFELATDGSGNACFEYLPCSEYSLTAVKGDREAEHRFIHKEDGRIELVVSDAGDEGSFMGGGLGFLALASIAVIAASAAVVYFRKANKSK
jgi:hypothetical protein